MISRFWGRSPASCFVAMVLWFVQGAMPVVQAADFPPPLGALKVPAVPGLLDGREPIIRDRHMAEQLGKALFWDMNVGADGVACGSCHFHAGADRRSRNQLDSGSKHTGAQTASTFEVLPAGKGGPDYQLQKADFPLFRFENPQDKATKVLFATDDVVSSAGVFQGEFSRFDTESGREICNTDRSDAIFHAGDKNTRRVSVRNAPTVFNAVYQYRNFWDGRANNQFNGVNAYGPRDSSAGLWIIQNGELQRQHLLLANSSLASQAVAPPLDDREMACAARQWVYIARHLLPLQALAQQHVHPEDSLLAALAEKSGKGLGLSMNYEAMVKKAFDPRFWAAAGEVPGAEGLKQIEANFPFFFGLAIQQYEATLISDKSRFDSPRDGKGFPKALDASEKRGLAMFASECALCHMGSNFTAASHPQLYAAKGSELHFVERREINGDFDGKGLAVALFDIGFANTSVTPTDQDIGLGATDPYGYPLSYATQYLDVLRGVRSAMVDDIRVIPCDFQRQFFMDFQDEELEDLHDKKCGAAGKSAWTPKRQVIAQEMGKYEQGRMLTAVQGAFKIPGLRNVELTGPYMHNGSMKNLEEVLDFYNRGGNVSNPHHVADVVFPRSLTDQERQDLLAFLKSLTDERVRWEQAPFDHPELWVAEGDASTHIQAVGRHGRSREEGPLKPFEAYLP